MTVPKKQSTAAKKARAAQQAGGGKYTAVLAAQSGPAVCGQRLDPFLVLPETCARRPHPHDEPCSTDRDFDAVAWKRRVAAEWAAEEARRAALTPEERAEEDERAREWEYDEMRAAADDGFDPYAKYYGDED
ncbi:hypothetical protein [Streptomyces caniscabiei]|uniref:Uncharacterized protein n=1 Tax=Streptomyces caniscabiei TaxID=2746961 RepID=A0ABU4MYM9_9ACTN|nr:hypothetical protein [Streptomyces caniscabiei]MBE4790325.1 hypothetical protein [Streptomyces caniscabiei]MBE4799446.1 hypothetical protein [Streptomyces caniscabiei]MDX3015182.1 hypothetical protein [Streptomyces caniscabiei]MDX3042625.1 hypothetical protein [Streptomyces caniscabiei]